MKEHFKITGMTCASCQNTVEKSVRKLEGVNDVSVSLLNHTMIVDFDPDQINTQKLVKQVKNAGYAAKAITNNPTEDAMEGSSFSQRRSQTRLWVSLVFLMMLFYISMGDMIGLPLPFFFTDLSYSMHFALAQFLLTLPIVLLNMHFFISGIKHLVHWTPNMDSLVSIGAIAAMINGILSLFVIANGLVLDRMDLIHSGRMNLYFEAAAAILVFVSLGKHLEEISKTRSTNAIRKLMDLSPKAAWVEREGEFIEIPAMDIVVGDLILVKPGMIVPVDGRIRNGTTEIDESVITGENLPVFKQAGDFVISATMNKTGAFQFVAEKVGKETTIAKIVSLVEETTAKKMPIQKLADRISGVFVPIVFAISLVSFIIWIIVGETVDVAMTMAIAVLVISCPCALGLATPVAVVVSMGKGAESGILLKNPDILEIAPKLTTIAFDKTGTITYGKPEVTDVVTVGNSSIEKLLTVAASLEQFSEHPLAKGIMNYIESKAITTEKIQDFHEIPGQGITGMMSGVRVLSGKLDFLNKDSLLSQPITEIHDQMASEGKTVVLVSHGQQVLGLIGLQDQLRNDSIEAIRLFRQKGLNVVMLTGDSRLAAASIQQKLALDQVYSQVKPDEKAKIIEDMQLKGEVVAMVGDGINDAVALSQASIGIAIGAGSEIAIDSADIVLMHSNLLDAYNAIILGQKTMRIIKTNLFWAFIYNLISIPIAAGVLVPLLNFRMSPIVAALAMSFSSVSVVLNALRLKGVRFEKGGSDHEATNSNHWNAL